MDGGTTDTGKSVSPEGRPRLVLQAIELNNLRRKVNFFEKMGWVRQGTVYPKDNMCHQKIVQVSGFEMSRPYLKEQTCKKCFHEFSSKHIMNPCPICQVMSTPVTMDNDKVVTFDNDTVDYRNDKRVEVKTIKDENPEKHHWAKWLIFLFIYGIICEMIGYFIGSNQIQFLN